MQFVSISDDPGETENDALADVAVTGPAPQPARKARLETRDSGSRREMDTHRANCLNSEGALSFVIAMACHKSFNDPAEVRGCFVFDLSQVSSIRLTPSE